MRLLALLLVAFSASAQVSRGVFLRTDPTRISIVPIYRTDPPSSPLRRRFIPSLRAQTPLYGPAFFSRMFVDETNRSYLGYELLLEQKEKGVYLATFGKLGVTPIELAARRGVVDLEWTLLPLPAIPEPRLVHEGDTITIELFADSTGDKLIDDIRINPLPPLRFTPVTPASRPVPTASGDPRDYSAADAEMQIIQPRAVRLNGTAEGIPIVRNVRGPLIWIYIPGHGRYVLSLVPRPGLEFTQAGEVRGGAISFKVGADSIELDCNNLIASGDSPYNLWVMHDKDWEPVSASQKDHPGMGSVSPAELSALKPK